MQISVNQIIYALNQIGGLIINTLRDDLAKKNVNATGRFSRSLKYTIKQEVGGITLEVIGHSYFIDIEKGSPPNDKILKKDLTDWLKARGIDVKYEYPIKRKIALKGTAMYRGEGRYEKPISETFDKTRQTIKDILTINVKKSITLNL